MRTWWRRQRKHRRTFSGHSEDWVVGHRTVLGKQNSNVGQGGLRCGYCGQDRPLKRIPNEFRDHLLSQGKAILVKGCPPPVALQDTSNSGVHGSQKVINRQLPPIDSHSHVVVLLAEDAFIYLETVRVTRLHQPRESGWKKDWEDTTFTTSSENLCSKMTPGCVQH